MLASFNYYGPATSVQIGGLVAAAIGLVILWFMRSIVTGITGGAFGGAIIALVVFGQGKGDMAEITQQIAAVIFGMVGALLGGIAGWDGKRSVRMRAAKKMKDIVPPPTQP